MENEQSLKQRKIALAQSEHASVIIELIKDVMPHSFLVAKTEWETICNAVTFDVYSTIIRDMVEYLERIRNGELHDK